MKILLLLFIHFLIGITRLAQAEPPRGPVALGFANAMHSKILNEERQFWVHLPYAATLAKDKVAENYPVIYLLDGDSNFNAVVSIVEHLSKEGRIPDMIVVGILHANRKKDMTVGVNIHEYPNDIEGKDAGGGAVFMRFIEKELMPYVESQYAASPYRIFIGHSLGGLSVTHALLHQSKLFNAYISLDASLWWDNSRLVTEAKALLPQQNYAGKSLYLAMANRLKPGMDLNTVLLDTSKETVLLRANLLFADLVKKNPQNGLRFHSHFYSNESHTSLPLIAEYDALRFIFDYYYFDMSKDSGNKEADFYPAIEAHFKIVSEKMGSLVPPNRALVNGLGYRALRNNQFDRAKQFFELNLKNYPKDANSYDSLGDYYFATGNKDKAKAMFAKALQVEELPEARTKLEAMKKE